MANGKLDEKTLFSMHLLYCRKNHGSSGSGKSLCNSCSELLNYSLERTVRCKWKKSGRLCSRCNVHCFEADKREDIRIVMRYAGPRLIFRNPLLALRHIVLTLISVSNSLKR